MLCEKFFKDFSEASWTFEFQDYTLELMHCNKDSDVPGSFSNSDLDTEYWNT